MAGFGVPGGDGGGGAEGVAIGGCLLGVLEDDVTAGLAGEMKPVVVGVGDFEGEAVVVGVGFAGKGGEAAGELIVPAVGGLGLSLHGVMIRVAAKMKRGAVKVFSSVMGAVGVTLAYVVDQPF